MNTEILEILNKISTERNIDIIYAVEAGSRAWGFESTDSDYDIRFIFKHKEVFDYLSLNDRFETIDGFSDDRKFDWQGWDLKKALKLLKQSNPSLLEWLYSPIIYYTDDKFANECKKIIEKFKHLRPLLYHYKSMAKSNYLKHINNQTQVPAKKYLYVIRPAAMVVWLLNENRSVFMEIDFKIVLEDIKNIIGDECYSKIKEIIEAKKLKQEMDSCMRIQSIDKWLDEIIFDKNEFKVNEVEISKNDFKLYDDLFYSYFDSLKA